MAKPTRSERRLLDATYFLDRDVDIRALKRRMVNVRKSHPCALGPMTGHDGCTVSPGDRALTESAIVDGSFGQWWGCVPCATSCVSGKPRETSIRRKEGR